MQDRYCGTTRAPGPCISFPGELSLADSERGTDVVLLSLDSVSVQGIDKDYHQATEEISRFLSEVPRSIGNLRHHNFLGWKVLDGVQFRYFLPF